MTTAQDAANDILVISNAEAGGLDRPSLERIVTLALVRMERRYHDVFRFDANMIDVAQTLSGPAQWKEAVVALCQAKVAFIDISDYTPGTMMLLGVRSVVRRGITLTFRMHEDNLPWNIREIKPIELSKLKTLEDACDHFYLVLADAWERFLKESAYCDLPVYDAIRALPTGDHRGIPPTEHILVLCSFSDRHKNLNWGVVKYTLQLVHAELGYFTELTSVSVIRTLDMHSATLVGRFLYDAIRRSSLCVIDWTDWRPSVFFEFGVRLAASNRRPICLIECGELTASPFAGQIEALMKLFAPIQYNISEMSGVSDKIKNRFETSLKIATDSAFCADETYSVVVDAFEGEHEQNIVPPVHVELLRSARMLSGDPQSSTHPVLYSQNRHIRSLAEHAALERLLAAWFYLNGRYTDQELRSCDSLRREFVVVGSEVLQAMGAAGRRGQKDLVEKILRKLKKISRLRGNTDGTD